MVDGIGKGLARAALISAGLVLVLYALVSTALLIAFKGRALAALAMHGLTVAVVFLASSGDKANSEHRWRAIQQRQADEERRRVDDERTALECLRVERLVLHAGEPLRADVHIGSTCPVTVTGLTVEGIGPGGYRAWIFDNQLKHAVSGTRTVTVSGRDALTETKDWVWTVEVDFETERSSLLERLFCGPGASSKVPEFKSCHPLPRVEP